jgi:hypothetical protein
MTTEYAHLRSHFERLIEMMQIKGNSEIHRKFWPADEFSDFESGDSVGTFSGRTITKNDVVRWAVEEGLDYQAKPGANPYQPGFIGSTDNHNGLPSDVAENDYVGSHGAADGTLAAPRSVELSAACDLKRHLREWSDKTAGGGTLRARGIALGRPLCNSLGDRGKPKEAECQVERPMLDSVNPPQPAVHCDDLGLTRNAEAGAINPGQSLACRGVRRHSQLHTVIGKIRVRMSQC